MSSNKLRNIAIVLLIIFIIILGFLSYVFIKNLRERNEKDFVAEFTRMGNEIYSDYYYKIVSVGKSEEQLNEFLEKFSTKGLKFDLVQLEKYSDEYKDIIEDFTKAHKDCKKEETMVIIYPKSPYSSIDFTSEIQMNCNYNKSTQ